MKLFCKTLAFLPGALALSVVLFAVRAVASDPALIRIGYQKYGTLNVVRARGDLDKTLSQQGKKVQWLLFTAGPQLVEALKRRGYRCGEYRRSAADFRSGYQFFSGLPW